MKCNQCGAEFEEIENQAVCPECGNPLAETEAAEETETTAEAEAAGEVPEQETESSSSVPELLEKEKPSGKNGKKLAIAGIAAVAIAAVGAFALTKGMEKDPKQTVITAFENIVPEGQVSPSEEFFGWSAMQTFLSENNSQAGMSLKVDQITEPGLEMLKTGGFRMEAKSDKTNKKSLLDLAVTYGNMDFIGMNAYFGDETMMLAVPQLSDKVFTLDLSEGLVDRISQSEFLAPALAQSGVDLDALSSYVEDLKIQADAQAGGSYFDLKGLYKRYQEGSKAQENFKGSLMVEKAEKAEWTVDGKTEKCRGYSVTVNKDTMITFLRESSDFFLNDETLRDDFLRQMELSVRTSEIFGAGIYGGEIPNPAQMQDQTYEQMKESVDQALTYLDKSLSDVQMQVYVDKKGRLAAVDAVTTVTNADDETQQLQVTFHAELQGGAYLTQNVKGSLILSEEIEGEVDSVEVLFTKQGVSDAKQLTNDFMVEAKNGTDGESYSLSGTGTYAKDDGSYHMAADVVANGTSVAKLSVSGVVDEMEKGKSFHAAMDEISVSVMGQENYVVLSGELFFGPMTGEVTAPQGTGFDVVAATLEDWQNVVMEAYFGIMSVTSQLGIGQ